MAVFTIALVILVFVQLQSVSLGRGTGNLTKTNRVVNGRLAKWEEVPYMVALLSGAHFFCGGAIYNERYIITAAHCLHGKAAKNLTVVVDQVDLRPVGSIVEIIARVAWQSPWLGGLVGMKQFKVKTYVMHPKYNNAHFTLYDIAIIELNGSLSWSAGVSAVRVPPQDWGSMADVDTAYVVDGNPYAKALFAGYGGAEIRKHDADEVPVTKILHVIELYVFSRFKCDWILSTTPVKDIYQNLEGKSGYLGKVGSTSKTAFCAGKYPWYGYGTCQGDSGGPLVCKYKDKKYLCGVLSGGYGCGLEVPKTFTEVSQFSDWIKKIAGSQPVD